MKNKIRNIFKNYKKNIFEDFQLKKEKVMSIWNKSNSKKKARPSRTIKTNKNKNNFKKFFKSFYLSIKNRNIFKRKFKIDPYPSLINKLKFINNKFSQKTTKENKINIYLGKIFSRYANTNNFSFLKNIYTNNKLNNFSSGENFSIDFLGIYYADHKLSIAHLQKKNNINFIKDTINIDAPGDLIGDFKVEKISELKRIIEDVINVLGLSEPPIILLLSSSFFTTRSFNDNDLVVFSEADPVILSKSPFLPDNTLLQYKRVNGDKNSSYHRVVYASKEVIDSWINVISLTGSEIATCTCSAIHAIEKIEIDNEISILCDIEDNSTTVYLVRKECELISTKLPFGTSVYISNNKSLNEEFFSRLKNCVKKILANMNTIFNGKIYLYGSGIDKMLFLNKKITDDFLKISTKNYELEKNKDFDTISNHSLFNSFSDALDMLIK